MYGVVSLSYIVLLPFSVAYLLSADVLISVGTLLLSVPKEASSPLILASNRENMVTVCYS